MRFAALRSFAAYEVGSVLRPCCISGLKVRFDRDVRHLTNVQGHIMHCMRDWCTRP